MGLDQYVYQINKDKVEELNKRKTVLSEAIVALEPLYDNSEDSETALNYATYKLDNPEETTAETVGGEVIQLATIESITPALMTVINAQKSVDDYKEKHLNTDYSYFRKVNQLQKYFEDKYDMDNCDVVGITEEDVEHILYACEVLIAAKDKSDDEYEKLAAETFPTTSGFFYFFYGDTDYGEYYKHEIENIHEVFTDIKNDMDKSEFYYSCWY